MPTGQTLDAIAHRRTRNGRSSGTLGIRRYLTLEQGDTFDPADVFGADAAARSADFTIELDLVRLGQATGAMTFTQAAQDGESTTIESTVYAFVETLASAYDVLIGGTASATAANLVAAINQSAGIGQTYHAGTIAHPTVRARRSGAVVTVTAIASGTAGDSIATTTDAVDASWSGATLSGGVIPNGVLVEAGGPGFGMGVVVNGTSLGIAAGEGAVIGVPPQGQDGVFGLAAGVVPSAGKRYRVVVGFSPTSGRIRCWVDGVLQSLIDELLTTAKFADALLGEWSGGICDSGGGAIGAVGAAAHSAKIPTEQAVALVGATVSRVTFCRGVPRMGF